MFKWLPRWGCCVASSWFRFSVVWRHQWPQIQFDKRPQTRLRDRRAGRLSWSRTCVVFCCWEVGRREQAGRWERSARLPWPGWGHTGWRGAGSRRRDAPPRGSTAGPPAQSGSGTGAICRTTALSPAILLSCTGQSLIVLSIFPFTYYSEAAKKHFRHFNAVFGIWDFVRQKPQTFGKCQFYNDKCIIQSFLRRIIE